jgi:TATA-binding protein-associated factor Taf7
METKKKKKAKRSELLSDEGIQGASKKELQKYQADNSDIFDVDFSTTLVKIRTEFIKQQAIFEAANQGILRQHSREIDDDDDEEDDSDGEDEEDDEDDEGEDEDEEQDDDDEDSGSDDEEKSKRRSSKKRILPMKPPKMKSPMKKNSKTVDLSNPLKSPPRSTGKAPPKSPTVANPSAVSDLLRPRVDLQRVATSAQSLGQMFVRGGSKDQRKLETFSK